MAYQEFYEAILQDNGPMVRELISSQLVDVRCIFVSHSLSAVSTAASSPEASAQNVKLQDSNQQCESNTVTVTEAGESSAREQHELGSEGSAKDAQPAIAGLGPTEILQTGGEDINVTSNPTGGLESGATAMEVESNTSEIPCEQESGRTEGLQDRQDTPWRSGILRLGPKLLPVPGLPARSGNLDTAESYDSSSRSGATPSFPSEPPRQILPSRSPLEILHIPPGPSLQQASPPQDNNMESSLGGAAAGGTTVMLDKNLACTEIRVEEVSDTSPDNEPAEHAQVSDSRGNSTSQSQGAAVSAESIPRRKQYRFKFDSSSLSDSEDSPPGVNPLEGLDITDIRFSELKLHSGARLEDWHRAEVALTDAQHFLRTPLTLAAKNNCRSVIEVLLWGAASADVYQQDGWLQSALHMVLWSGNTCILQLMVDQGCDITQPFEDGCTPLHLAAKYGKQGCVELLLRSGSQVNAEDFQERTPLHMAASHGHTSCLPVLLAAGANVNHLDCHNHTALHSTDSGECASLLLKAGVLPNRHLDALDVDQNSTPRPLEIVTHHAKENHTKVVGVLLEAGYPANVDHPWLRGRDSPLHWAICNASSECVNLLLKANADVNAQNSCGNTPLMVASTRYHTLDKRANYDDVQRLIDAGCSLNITNDAGQSALHMATKCRNLEFVKILVKNNANVDIVDSRSRTALMYTAMLSSADVLLYWNLGTDWEVVYIAKLLLQANCNVHLRDKYRRSALVLAIPEVSVNGPQISEPLVTLLVLAGSKIPPKKVTSAWKKASSHSRLDAHEKQALAKVVRIMTWLDAVRSNPVSLQQKCRLVIRRCLGTPIHNRVAQLAMPAKLKNYILLKDLDEVVEEYWRAHDTAGHQPATPSQLTC